MCHSRHSRYKPCAPHRHSNFKFRGFVDPSDQNELYRTPLISKIWDLIEKFKLSFIVFPDLSLTLSSWFWETILAWSSQWTVSYFLERTLVMVVQIYIYHIYVTDLQHLRMIRSDWLRLILCSFCHPLVLKNGIRIACSTADITDCQHYLLITHQKITNFLFREGCAHHSDGQHGPGWRPCAVSRKLSWNWSEWKKSGRRETIMGN